MVEAIRYDVDATIWKNTLKAVESKIALSVPTEHKFLLWGEITITPPYGAYMYNIDSFINLPIINAVSNLNK